MEVSSWCAWNMIPAGMKWADVEDDEVVESASPERPETPFKADDEEKWVSREVVEADDRKRPLLVFADVVEWENLRVKTVKHTVKQALAYVREQHIRWWHVWDAQAGLILAKHNGLYRWETEMTGYRERARKSMPASDWQRFVEGMPPKHPVTKIKSPKARTPANMFELLR